VATGSRESRPPGHVREPSIASGLVRSLRGSLIEHGAWPAVYERFQASYPDVDAWLESASQQDWVSMEGHMAMVEALGAVIGVEKLAELGSARLRASLQGGFLAPIIRSWARSFSEPGDLVRVLPHAWQAIARGCGRAEEAGSGDGWIRYVIHEVPDSLIGRLAWHVLVEGFYRELVQMSGRDAEVSITARSEDHSLVLDARWDPVGTR